MDLSQLSRDTGLPSETVRTRWKQLSGLPSEQKDPLDPAHVARLWETDTDETLDFLWACVHAGGLIARWQVFHPTTGWVLDDVSGPDALRRGTLSDPFDPRDFLSDLGTCGRVVFCFTHQAYAGSWEDYARFRRTEPGPTPLAYRVLAAWEVGKLEFELAEDEQLQLVCLENLTALTLTGDSAKVIGGRSFIGKMKQYRAQKFLLSLQRRVIDLKVTGGGFETEQTLIAPGKIVYWLENLTDEPVMVHVWKTPLPEVSSARPQANLLASLGRPSFRRVWSTLHLGETFRHDLSGLVYLSVDFSRAEGLFHDWDDTRTHEALRRAMAQVRQVVHAQGGFVSEQGAVAMVAAFPSATAALAVALDLRRSVAAPVDSVVPVLSLTAGKALLVDRAGVPGLFGYHVQLARVFQNQAFPGELWMSLGFASLEDVSARLATEGLDLLTEMLSVTGEDQKVLAYRILASSTSPA